MEKKQYQLIIIGTGPAGLTASIYASRYKIEHLVIGEASGGLAAEAHKICNYPSEKEISGMELMNKMREHAQSLGVEIVMDRVVDIENKKDNFKVKTQLGKEFSAQTILLTIGTKRRQLKLPGEEKFLGKGVSYCATCDAMFYRDKTVAVVGGSDSATTASLYLSQVAKKVYQIYRKSNLRGDPTWIEQALNNPKIEIIYNTNVVGLFGGEKLTGIKLDVPYQGEVELKLDGLFIEIGSEPDKEIINHLKIAVDNKDQIKVNADQSTNVKNIWAAGDITNGSNGFRQVITAASEGAIAAESIFKHLQQQK